MLEILTKGISSGSGITTITKGMLFYYDNIPVVVEDIYISAGSSEYNRYKNNDKKIVSLYLLINNESINITKEVDKNINIDINFVKLQIEEIKNKIQVDISLEK